MALSAVRVVVKGANISTPPGRQVYQLSGMSITHERVKPSKLLHFCMHSMHFMCVAYSILEDHNGN